MKRNKLIITIILTLMATICFAQENSMTRIQQLVGKWQIENYASKNNKWKVLGITNSTIELVHKGKFISENSKYLTPFGEINMLTHIGFDTRQNKLKLSAMDLEYGLMDIYLGDWINGELIFDNLESDLPVTFDDGSKMHFRLTYKDIGENRFTHLVEGTTDNGKTWLIFSKSIFQRNAN